MEKTPNHLGGIKEGIWYEMENGKSLARFTRLEGKPESMAP